MKGIFLKQEKEQTAVQQCCQAPRGPRGDGNKAPLPFVPTGFSPPPQNKQTRRTKSSCGAETCRGHQQLCHAWHQLGCRAGSGRVPVPGEGGGASSAEAWSPWGSPQQPNTPIPSQSHTPAWGKSPQALLHLWMLILQDCAAGGCAFLCCLSSLPAATKWSQALVFSNTHALPHAVCCSSTKEVLECLL